MIYYFSGTGNSAWVAKTLANTLADKAVCLSTAMLHNEYRCSLGSDEPLGFVFPIYGWMPPAIVLRFMEQLAIANPPAYVYFVCTCGDDTGKASRVFSESVAKKGWCCKAGFSVTMPNTYVCLPGFDVDTKEVENAKLHAAKSRVEEITTSVEKRTTGFDCHEGAWPWVKTYVLGSLFSRFLMSPAPFRSTADCISCRKCERSCPLHNIRMENERPQWGENCSLCLSCYHHCPKHAVAYGNQTRRKGQYVHPY